jgi:hypothetical protein
MDEEDGKIPSAERLSECSVNIFTGSMPIFGETDAGLAE